MSSVRSVRERVQNRWEVRAERRRRGRERSLGRGREKEREREKKQEGTLRDEEGRAGGAAAKNKKRVERKRV